MPVTSVVSKKKKVLRTAREIIDILSENQITLTEEYSISSLALFGSYVRNTQREESDVDILIDFAQPIGLRIVDLKLYLENLLNIEVDIVSANNMSPEFYSFIKNETVYVIKKF